MLRLQVGFQHTKACRFHRRHHAVGADGDDAIDVGKRDGHVAQLATGISEHGLDDISDEALVLGTGSGDGLGTGKRIDGPYDDIGCRLDLLYLEDTLDGPVAGNVDDPVARFAHGFADGEQHRVAEPAAGEQHGLVCRDLCRRSRGAHDDDLLPGLPQRAQLRRRAHLQSNERDEPFVPIYPGARERQCLGGQRRVLDNRSAAFEILDAIELPGVKLARRHGCAGNHLDDRRRHPMHRFHGGDQLVIQGCDQRSQRRVPLGLIRCIPGAQLTLEQAHDIRVAVLRARHGLDYIARVDGVVVAEKADVPAVLLVGGERRRCSNLWNGAVVGGFQGRAIAVPVGLEAAEKLAIQVKGSLVLVLVDDVG